MNGRLVPVLGLAVLIGLALAAVVWRSGDDVPTAERSTEAAAASAASASPSDSAATTEAPPPSEPAPSTTIPVLRAAPSLEGLDGWLQSHVRSLTELRGKVVVLQFWTFGCINCKRTLPHLQELAATHAEDEFEIVGVHSPEFTYEEDPVAIQEAADQLGVTWPIALDTEQTSFFAWQGSPAYWPRTYVIDRNGDIRFDHVGEGAYEELAAVVAALLEAP